MPGSMLILTWVSIIFVKILHLAARCKIMTNIIMPTHVKISIGPGIRELVLKFNLECANSLLQCYNFSCVLRIIFLAEIVHGIFHPSKYGSRIQFTCTFIQSADQFHEITYFTSNLIPFGSI